MSVRRIFVEKKPEYAVRAKELRQEIENYLGIGTITDVRVLIRYDVEDVSEEVYKEALVTIFSEPPVDFVYEESFPSEEGDTIFTVEYLPGQFDQRADSAEQCVKLLNEEENPVIKSATTYVISGTLTKEQAEAVKSLCINPVDSRENNNPKPATLVTVFDQPEDVKIFEGFCDFAEDSLGELYSSLNLAMTFKDFLHIQNYFKNEEKRDPSVTEIRVLDTYWSDHCRHTTFQTELKNVEFTDGDYNEPIEASYRQYLADREEIFKGRDDKFVCLMDLALMAMRKLRKEGKLEDLEESEEINACSIVVPVVIDGQEEEWLVNFKNETHNHPTEIEPFGGAATCLGGAIRDPLSGRTYVYQAMRVTGAADPTRPMSETLHGKLPQKRIVTDAAHGYSSYGNQIGLATGYVKEIYHPDYVAKRMEIGAVMAAAPRKNVIRETSDPGDVIILMGGRTGRDGIGGATGSSKVHTEASIEVCGAEVQKGNPPTERKLQRLFRRPEVSSLIKKCNDFGAGGVSVAIGELADGLYIDLNKVTKKYDGLDGTELAISESQERMAVALAPEDVDKFIAIATEENLEATPVAKVTEEKRLNMVWNGKSIVNISREFLNSNGAEKHQNVHIEKGTVWQPQWAGVTFEQKMKNMVGDLNVCSKKGLSERFDSTIGAATVLMPFGGACQLTPQNAMVAKLPVDGETNTCSGMAWGYNPYLMSANQYVGARMAVVESVTKLVASGFRYEDAYLTFQEYFERLGTSPERWGKPLAALLGALDAQIGLGIASIGGKDSMSGSFEQLDVPPTLVSFATAIGKAGRVVSTEFKKPESTVVLIRPILDPVTGCPNFFSLKANYKKVEQMMEDGMVAAASSVGYGGLAEALFKMGLGNRIGFKMMNNMTTHDMFKPMYGSIVLEMVSDAPAGELLGETTADYTFECCGDKLDMAQLQEIWESKLEPVYPYRKAGPAVEKINGSLTAPAAPKIGVAKPKVIIPVFPGTNCEYDTAHAFARAGADPEVLVIRNLTPADVTASCEALVKAINESQIVMLPGGFSGGDEPDGSAKFIASFFRNPAVTEAVRDLLQHRDGLMLGICNGFQALIKLGLAAYGDIRPITACDPTLTFNTIGRHQSMLVRTRIASTGSPWLSKCSVGDQHTVAISHGEGRFVAPQSVLDTLIANGQIATQYVDQNGSPSMDMKYNPNGSVLAIEGITSPDGRVFGKMGHSERSGEYLYKNVTGDKYQPIFEGGVDYFKL